MREIIFINFYRRQKASIITSQKPNLEMAKIAIFCLFYYAFGYSDVSHIFFDNRVFIIQLLTL